MIIKFNRWFKGETIMAVIIERISTETGTITKAVSAIPITNSGWEMKTFTCWRMLKIIHYELNWRISKATKGMTI